MTSGRSCILAYHSIDATGSVISISPETFRGQMAWLAANGTPVVPLSEVRDTPGAVSLTFDDGFRNFFEHAFPVLDQYHFPATVFVIAGYCGARNDWPSQPAHPAIPTLELMRWSVVEQIAKSGISVGSHTVTHPRMSGLSEAEAEMEVSLSQAIIENRIGKAVDTFAYPYGDYTPAVRRVVERRFRWACGTQLSFVSRTSDPVCLPRIDAYYLRNQFWFRSLERQHGVAYLAGRRFLRELRNRVA